MIPVKHQHPARQSALTLGLFACLLSLARLTAADSTPPVIVSINPPPGTVNDHLEQITITFSEPVTGVDIDDLLINDLPMTGVTGADDTYTFTTLQPAFGPLRLTWTASHAITDLANPFR